jgi:hypothetical protein
LDERRALPHALALSGGSATVEQGFHGLISDLRIFDRTLTYAEVRGDTLRPPRRGAE